MSVRRRSVIRVGISLLVCAAFSRSLPAAAATTEATYEAVQSAFLREDFEVVVALAPLALAGMASEPTSSRVWLWLALSLDRLQRANEALTELERLKTRLGPDDPLWAEVLYWEGEISRRAFQMLRARLAYQRLLTEFPESSWRSQAQLGLGFVHFHQQAFEVAASHFHEVALREPTSPVALEATLFEGLCALRLERFHQGAALFRQLLTKAPDASLRAKASFYLGEALTGLRRYDEALSAYHETIRADSNSVWGSLATFGLGWAYFKLHRCGESLNALAAYLERKTPEHYTETLFAQGSCLKELAKSRDALAKFEQLTSRDPDHPLAMDSRLAMGELLRRESRFEEARASLYHVVGAREPAQRERAHLALGAVWLDQWQLENADASFQSVVGSRDAAIRQAALNGLGDVQMGRANYPAARRWYEESVRLNASGAAGQYAAFQLGRVLLESAEAREAMQLFQRLLGTVDESLKDDVRLALALSHLALGERDPAYVQLETVRQAHPGSVPAARAAYYLALVAYDENRLDEARTLCEETVTVAPKTEEAIDAFILLAEIMAEELSPEGAYRFLTKVLEHQPAVARARRGKLSQRLGDLSRQMRDYATAIRWYEEAWTLLPPRRGELEYHMAACFEVAGDFEAATARYQAIHQSPWSIRGQLAVAKLLERDDQWEAASAIYESISQQRVPEAHIAQERLAALERTTEGVER